MERQIFGDEGGLDPALILALCPISVSLRDASASKNQWNFNKKTATNNQVPESGDQKSALFFLMLHVPATLLLLG